MMKGPGQAAFQGSSMSQILNCQDFNKYHSIEHSFIPDVDLRAVTSLSFVPYSSKEVESSLTCWHTRT
jgi:hypothetical protein